jgi:hypothetical protein
MPNHSIICQSSCLRLLFRLSIILLIYIWSQMFHTFVLFLSFSDTLERDVLNNVMFLFRTWKWRYWFRSKEKDWIQSPQQRPVYFFVYLSIHSVTHVTLDTPITDYNLYITTQLICSSTQYNIINNNTKSLNNRNVILKCMEKYAQRKIFFRETKWLLSKSFVEIAKFSWNMGLDKRQIVT